VNLSVGIVGLPTVGKTALFKALTKRSTGGGRSTTATVPVPDERLDVLAEMFKPKRVVNAGVQMVDVAGLIKGGAAKEGGLGGQFLGQLQGVNALALVLRCFDAPELGLEPPRPLDDLESMLLEFQLSDLSRIDKRSCTARGKNVVGVARGARCRTCGPDG
jgi:ribosome-binding ATPase YchF (GTP1/OBG family)